MGSGKRTTNNLLEETGKDQLRRRKPGPGTTAVGRGGGRPCGARRGRGSGSARGCVVSSPHPRPHLARLPSGCLPPRSAPSALVIEPQLHFRFFRRSHGAAMTRREKRHAPAFQRKDLPTHRTQGQGCKCTGPASQSQGAFNNPLTRPRPPTLMPPASFRRRCSKSQICFRLPNR
jgi:hypothetical protein